MIELPRNLKPKTKIAVFKFQNIIYAIIFTILTSSIINQLTLNKMMIMGLYLIIFIVDIIIIFYEKDGRDFPKLLKDNIMFIIEPKYLIYDKKKIKKDGVKERVLKTDIEKQLELNKQLNIKNEKTLKGRDGYYYRYLEIKIRKNPRFETSNQKNKSINDFNKLILEIEKNSNGKIFTTNTKISDSVYEQSINKYQENKAYYNLKQFQVNQSKEYFNLRYFIEIRNREVELLEIKANTLISTFTGNLYIEQVEHELVNQLIKMKHNYTDLDIHSNYVYNKKAEEYETYMSLKSFNILQDYYYLRSLFSSQYDVVMMYRKPKDFSDMKTLNSAYAELRSNQKYDKTITGKIKNDVQQKQLYQITADLETAKGELYAIDIIVKVVAKDLETLNKRRGQMHVFFKGKLEFLDNTYLQKQTLLKFHKLGVDIKDKYVIPNEHLSYSYPFNFVKFVQSGGLLKNADRENLLIIDNQRKGGNQMSFGTIMLGDKGSGKSTAIKESVLDDLYHYNSNVIMIDFDSETETMANNFGGQFIDIAGMPINILRVNINPLTVNNVEDHIAFVSSCIKILYPDLKERYFRKVLSEVYCNFGISNDSIFEKSKYPTINDIIEYLKTQLDKPAKQLLDILNDMHILYPYLTSVDKGFEFNNKLISISFNSVKRDDILTNMMMYYFVTLISKRTSLNHFSPKYYPNDDEKLRKYLKYYMQLINDEDNFSIVSKFTREELKIYFEENKKMFSIKIDEAHRIFKYPELVKNLLPIAREDRKYFTSLTFADQSTHSLETNEDFLLIYSLMQYKIFFSLEETNKDFLSKLNFLPQEISDITSGRFEAGEGILKIGENTYKINSRITKEIDDLFEGRN